MPRLRSHRTILRDLRASAKRRARRRGHLLGRFHTSDGAQARDFYHAHCLRCACGVSLSLSLEGMGGSALRQRCLAKGA